MLAHGRSLNAPSDRTLAGRRLAAVPRGVASATPHFAERAENAQVWDSNGQCYIDFSGGIGVLATGHRHPTVIDAVHRQLERFTHTSFQVLAYEPYLALAERLNALAPFTGPAKTLLLTTGVEAVEAAVKIARVATRRSAVIAFSGAFHGRSQLGMSLTGKHAPYKRGVTAFDGNVYRIPFPISYQGVSLSETLGALERVFRTDAPADTVASIILEPVQGEGGFHVAPPELLHELRSTCDAHGIVLIADEIQSGIARTGRMFAIEHSGVEPDLVTVAKSLAGGFPLSGVLGRAHLMDAPEPGGLGGTYGGSPVGCAAALAVLDVIEQEHLLDRARTLGATIRSQLEMFAARSDLAPIGNIRGLGAMLGFDLMRTRGSTETDPVATKRVVQASLAKGLILLSCGTIGETIRLLLPLTTPDETVREALDILERALHE